MTTYNVVSPGAMVAGQVEDISVILSNFQAIAAVLNGNLDNTNLAPGAAIVPSKIAGYPALSSVFLRGDGAWAAAGSLSSVKFVTGLAINSANYDLALADVNAYNTVFRVGTGGGSIRSIQAATLDGSVIEIQNASSQAVTLLHQVGGGPVGYLSPWLEGVNVVIPSSHSAIMGQAAGSWIVIGIVPMLGAAQVLIQEIILGADGVIDFQSIPAIYRHLMIEANLRGSDGTNKGDYLRVRLNADAGGSSYQWNGDTGNGLGDRMELARITGGAAAMNGAGQSRVKIDFPYYRNIDGQVGALCNYVARTNDSGTASSDISQGFGGGVWIGQGAGVVLNRIQLYTSFATGNLKANSKASLYGIA